MLRGDWLKFKNRAEHIDPQRDNDVTMYAYKGNIYYRIGNGQPHLIGGQTVIHNYVQSNTGSDVGFRSGRTQYATAGSYDVAFYEPLGVTGTDYNVLFDVRDANGAVPAFDVPPGDKTKYGFRVIIYDDNISFGWTATLNTQ